MKAIVQVLGIGALGIGVLTSTGCAPPSDGASAGKVAELEKRIQILEERNRDLTFKGRLVSSQLFDSPLRNFFDADEFWENPYDSGQADCARRCAETATAEREVCADIADCVQRQQCYQEAAQRASACQTQCSASNPPDVP